LLEARSGTSTGCGEEDVSYELPCLLNAYAIPQHTDGWLLFVNTTS